MPDGHAIALPVSTELADAFEAHAHLLAPARIVGEQQPRLNPRTRVYYLHHPDAPDGAASMTPIFERTADGPLTLQSIAWLDTDGHQLTQP